MNTVWIASVPLDQPEAEPARRYFTNRGLGSILGDLPVGDVLRLHPNLEYWHQFEDYQPFVLIGRFPTLVSLIRSPCGEPVSLHRTFLTSDGHKAQVPGAAKKLMPPVREGAVTGGAIRFFSVGDHLAVAEGIETGLAVRVATGASVWATVSAGGMKSLVVPESVRSVDIWADRDHSKAGEAAAQALAERLTSESRMVRILLPPGTIPDGEKGCDWLDVLNRKDAAA